MKGLFSVKGVLGKRGVGEIDCIDIFSYSVVLKDFSFSFNMAIVSSRSCISFSLVEISSSRHAFFSISLLSSKILLVVIFFTDIHLHCSLPSSSWKGPSCFLKTRRLLNHLTFQFLTMMALVILPGLL